MGGGRGEEGRKEGQMEGQMEGKEETRASQVGCECPASSASKLLPCSNEGGQEAEAGRRRGGKGTRMSAQGAFPGHKLWLFVPRRGSCGPGARARCACACLCACVCAHVPAVLLRSSPKKQAAMSKRSCPCVQLAGGLCPQSGLCARGCQSPACGCTAPAGRRS